jgi:hypothetical protein
MDKDKDGESQKKKNAPAPGAPDTLSASEPERRAARTPRADGRPLWPEETAPGERGDAPYGDSEPGKPTERPGV